MKTTTKLRELLKADDIIVTPGIYDCLTARLAETSGFKAVKHLGNVTCGSLLGLPDLGLIGLNEMANHARNVAASVIGAVTLLLAIPLVVPLVRIFGSPELFVLALWGISMVGLLSGKSLAKGVAMGALGLLLGTVGLDPQRAIPRYTLGIPYLADGIPLIAVSLGLFASPQAIELIQRRTLLNVSKSDLRIDFAATFEGVRG